MNAIRIRWRQGGLAAALVFGLAGCGGGEDAPAAPVLTVDAAASSGLNAAQLSSVVASCPAQPVSQAEIASLLYMRQEEQLAHDVYAVASSAWSQPLFANIAASETTHAEAIVRLLERYGLTDPLSGLPPGTYASPELQALYATLADQSRSGVQGAVLAGLQIEELDMRDIAEHMGAVDNCDIQQVYGELLRGSRNHLRAFWKSAQRLGLGYVPRYITQAQFDAIVASEYETGSVASQGAR
jgi:hypothetical protein